MIFDIVVLAVFFVSCLVAFLRGLIREVLTILGLVGGLLAAWLVGPLLAPAARGWLQGGQENGEAQRLFGVVPYGIVADALAYGGIFLVVVIALSVVSYFLSKSARAVGLGAVDRSLGVLFGMVRAVAIVGLLYLPVHMLMGAEDRENLFGDSRLRPYVETVAGWMQGALPENWRAEGKEDAAGKTREKLQALDILRPGGAQDGGTDAPEGTAPGDGYGNDQRQDMKDLIIRNLND